MAKYTLDMLGAEIELIANRMRTAQTSDKAEILAQIDAVALRSAQLTDQKAEELKARLDVVATNFEASSKDRFNALSDQLHDSVVDILGNIQELKAGQKRIKSNQDSWGNRIMDGLKDLGNRIGSYVSTPAIIIEGIISLIIGIVVCFLTKDGASRVMEKVYDENLTPIGAVPRYGVFESWGIGIAFGILAAVVIFAVAYGVSKLISRHK